MFDALFNPGAPGLVDLPLPLTPVTEVSLLDAIRSHPAVKAILPLPVLAIAVPIVWRLFRGWWREADEEAAAFRRDLLERGQSDTRPYACLMLTAVILTLQEYFGGRGFYDTALRPLMMDAQAVLPWLKPTKYDELYGYVWWSLSRFVGYTFVPFAFWKIAYPNDSLLDMGLRVRGFFTHLWIYAACFGLVLIGMAFFALQDDFLRYYPFYKSSSRSWWDLGAWEAVYFLQFVGLEIFFRGWMVGAMRRSLGSMAVFAMAVPYCMIHYGKPYEEALGAILAGVFLGTLALRTLSVWGGLLVHLAVALSMDLLSLWTRDALPNVVWAPG